MKFSAHKSWIAAGLLATALAAGGADKHDHAHWGYSGKTGPDHWGSLADEFSLCNSGQRQSPIDLDATLGPTTVSMSFHYRPSPLKVINNGHTIQVNYAPGSYAELDGKRYELAQFHFHSPSEHTVKGEHIDMEAHLVHRDAAGKLAVVGVFLQQGRELGGLQGLWKNLPKHAGEKTVEGVSVNASALLPPDRKLYGYSGSLTTPPCSEGVSWFVIAEPLEVSAQQLRAFQKIISANARPVQPLNGRGALAARR